MQFDQLKRRDFIMRVCLVEAGDKMRALGGGVILG